MIGSLAERAASDLLATQNNGRLGCRLDNEPDVVPVHYLFKGDSIYLHSLPGRKIKKMQAHSCACLQIDTNQKNPSHNCEYPKAAPATE